jgi:hypothetical protein
MLLNAVADIVVGLTLQHNFAADRVAEKRTSEAFCMIYPPGSLARSQQAFEECASYKLGYEAAAPPQTVPVVRLPLCRCDFVSSTGNPKFRKFREQTNAETKQQKRQRLIQLVSWPVGVFGTGRSS